MNKLLITTILGAAFLGAPAAGARDYVEIRDTVQHGFNAMDYLLQKPAPARTFAEPESASRFFVSGSAGMSQVYIVSPRRNFGFRGNISLGGWFTPVHGWRIGLGAGSHGRLAHGQAHTFFVGGFAEYQMNFSALLRGDNPARKFDLIGGLGIEYQRVGRSGGYRGDEYGFRASLQARWNVTPSLYLYAEPAIAGLHGRTLNRNDWRRYKVDMSLSVGIGYRLLRGAERLRGSEEFISLGEDHLFFGLGGGLTGGIRGPLRSELGDFWSGQLYVGKMFTPAIGLRLNGQAGNIGHAPSGRRRYNASAGLNLVWDLSSTFGGYRPDEVFNFSINIGPSLAFASNAGNKLYLGLEGGLGALFRVSHNWGIYIEPRMQVYKRSYISTINRGAFSPQLSLFAGVRYTIGDYSRRFPADADAFGYASRSFIDYSAGWADMFTGNFGQGAALSVAYGLQSSPVSSWRFGLEGQFFSKKPQTYTVLADVDYIFSFSASSAGYNPDRLFDMSGVIGLGVGIQNRSSKTKAYFQAKAGLKGSFRLSDRLSLFIEPDLIVRNAGSVKKGWRPEGRVLVGLTQKF